MITESFDQIKQTILKNLSSGIDFSPKGSIDLPVRDLVYLINKHPHFVTTSSCSGRLSISLPSNESKGVNWLLVKHSFVELEEILNVLSKLEALNNENSLKLVTMKCEPFIMHLCCRDVEHAKQLHTIAMENGFRESGITLGSKKVMLAIRTTAFNLELPIARYNQLLFPQSYLSLILDEANSRLKLNFARIDRLLTQFKNFIGYPHVHFSKIFYHSEELWSKRWGHAVVPMLDNSIMLMGGQGVEKVSINQLSQEVTHSGRNLQTMRLIQGNDLQLESVDGIPSCMHSIGVSLCSSTNRFFLLSGGRQAPTKALPCAQVYIQTSKPENSLSYQSYGNYREVGDVPLPRWGHSLHPMRCSLIDHIDESPQKYFLFGGRNESEIFCDGYTLTIYQSRDDSCIILEWKRLEFKMHSEAKLTANQLLGRVYHASCLLKQDIYHSVSSKFGHENDYNYNVLVHGGIVSLIDPSPTDSWFTIDPVLLTIQQLSNSPPCPRFSHTITPILGKSVLLFGGVSSYDRSFDVSEKVIFGEKFNSLQSHSHSIVIDYGWNNDGSIKFYQTRNLTWDYDNEIDNSSNSTENELPCQECRANHQLVYFPNRTDSSHSFVYVIGGGATTLAFGDHYCCSLKGEVAMRKVMQMNQSILKSKGFVNTVDDKLSKSSLSSTIISGSPDHSNPVLLIDASHVKHVKTWLERKSWLNKAIKIFPVEVKVLESASFVVLHDGDSPEYSVEKFMAIPIKESLLIELRACSSVTSSNLLQELQTILPDTNRLHYLSYFDHSKDATNDSDSFAASGIVKSFDGANASTELLRSIILNAQMPTSCSDDIPKKYEFVGDIVMIPENSLLHPAWEQWNLQQIEQQKFSLWHLISDCFRGKRVARKALIRNNELRQSQVQLLYLPNNETMPSNTCDKSNESLLLRKSGTEKKIKLCKCGHDHATQPGWVTVHENKIGFSFDITRVMFCSGNITERMRMGNYVMQDHEVVVDFYSGIGYYTVPILYFHPNVKHLYACEWNPDSIFSLRHNLIVAGVDSSRYTIIAGDNRITSVETLHNLADRILLGLLPSSTQGWVLAVRALKRTGGIIHIHENIFEKDLEDWLNSMIKTFKKLFEEEKHQDMSLSILHVEKVKSYAPRVYHYVIDIRCAPNVLNSVVD